MKNLILSLVLFVSTLTTFSQTITLEFDNFTNFNTGDKGTYEEVIDSTNYLKVTKSTDSPNKYIIDLDNKTISLYSKSGLVFKTTIIDYTKNNGLLLMTVNDVETLTGRKIISTVVVNTNKNNKKDPYFLSYFVSTVTNTTNGVICMK